MGKIGLIDVDGHNFPNLALMKISAWHKAQGDDVEWCFPMEHYDIVYGPIANDKVGLQIRKLKDGSIMFGFTEFIANDWEDDVEARISYILSYDNGETWSDKKVLFE